MFRSNIGYTASELVELEERFKYYDTDGSGDINNRELPKLLEDLFPSLSTSAQMRPKLLKLLKEVDVDEDLELDFQDFLRLMRQFHDLQDRERIIKEQTAVNQTKFSNDEVEEFRSLFMGENGAEGYRTELPFSELAKMIAQICPLGDSNRAALLAIFREVVDKHEVQTEGFVDISTHEVDKDKADFPDFLILMRHLLDVNFANLEQATTGAADMYAERVRANHRASVYQ